MFVAEAVLALLLALALGFLMSAVLGVRGPWAAPWALFLVLFLAIWAGGVWIAPAGPAVGEVTWLPFVLVGLVVALLIAAGTPSSPPRGREALAEARAREQVAAAGLTVFFWAFVAVLLVAIFAYYL